MATVVITTSDSMVKIAIDGVTKYTGSEPVITPVGNATEVVITAKEFTAYVKTTDTITIDGDAYVPASLDALIGKMFEVFQVANSSSGGSGDPSRFGVSGEDDSASADRTFASGTHDLTIEGGASEDDFSALYKTPVDIGLYRFKLGVGLEADASVYAADVEGLPAAYMRAEDYEGGDSAEIRVTPTGATLIKNGVETELGGGGGVSTIVLESPDGSQFLLGVDDMGALITSELAEPVGGAVETITLTSADTTQWEVSISNEGVLITTEV